MTHRRISFCGLPLDVNTQPIAVLNEEQSTQDARLVTTLGPEAWSVVRRNPRFRYLLQAMDLVVPDGPGLALACRLLTGQTCEHLAFDTAKTAGAFFAEAEQYLTPLALIGGEPCDDEAVAENLKEFYPSLNLVATSHGYGDFAPKIAAILTAGAELAIVSMPPLRQEEFLIALRQAGFKGTAIGTSSFIPTYVAAIKDGTAATDSLFTFLHKIIKEPKRLWQRYALGYKDLAYHVVQGIMSRQRQEQTSFGC